MKKIICLLSLLIFLSGCCCQEKQYKYEIKNTNGLTLLIDKTNGLVWRNIDCGENNVPNCWELMQYMGAVVPDGDEQRRHDEFEKINEAYR